MELTMFTRTVIVVLFLFIAPLALAAKFPMPAFGNDVIGQIQIVRAQHGDTLETIGERFGIGLHEMTEANPRLNPNELYDGQDVIVPTSFVLPKYRQGIVINVPECRLYYFDPHGKYVLTYPVGLGRKGWRTPTTSTTVIRKSTNPIWTVPKTIRSYILEQTGNLLPNAVPPGPENPLGRYALYLGTHGYLIHGTNQPWSIGKLISAGCIRLYNADVRELYPYVKTGTPVRIIHQPYKAGWQDGRLYLEAHVPLTASLQQRPSDLNLLSVEKSVLSATSCRNAQVNWQSVREVVQHQDGMPEPVSFSLGAMAQNNID